MNVLLPLKPAGSYQLSAYHNTILVNEPRSAFLVVFEPEATAAERAGWRLQHNVAYAFLDRLSLRADPRRGQRRNLLPLASEPGAIERNHLIAAGEEAKLFLDFARDDFRPRPGGPLDAKGQAIPGLAEGRDGRPPSVGALETAVPPWTAGADWLPAGVAAPATPATPAAAAKLARQLRPAALTVGRPSPGFDQP